MSRGRLYKLLLGLSLAGYAWLGWNVAEGVGTSITPAVCLFKSVAHLPCPSCGSTRAVVLLAQGDIGRSILENPLGVILAIALVIVPLWITVDALRKSDSLLRWYVQGERLLSRNKWISVPAIALVVINWVWNIAKGL